MNLHFTIDSDGDMPDNASADAHASIKNTFVCIMTFLTVLFHGGLAISHTFFIYCQLNFIYRDVLAYFLLIMYHVFFSCCFKDGLTIKNEFCMMNDDT
jgi:hypothetical protein